MLSVSYSTLQRAVKRAWGGVFLASACMLVVQPAPAPAQTCEEITWEQVNAQPVSECTMAYDSDRQVLVYYSSAEGTTWESVSGEAWVLRTASVPASRSGTAMVYDAARHVTLLFGGSRSGYLSDTWQWDGTIWTLLTDTGPTPRVYHAMVYDPDNQRVLLFGGDSAAGRLDDLWAWNGTAWTLLAAGGPSARYSASLAYDTARHRAVLFGGFSATSPFYQGDTWEFDGTAWSLAATTGPAARSRHASAYDPLRGVTVVYAGYGRYSPLQDTWEWNGTSWTQAAATSVAGARYTHAMAFHPGLNRLVMAGGVDGSGNILSSHAWEWAGSDWAPLSEPPIAPPANAGGQMVYDSLRLRSVLVVQPYQAESQTWEWDGQQWLLRIVGGPDRDNGYAAVYDSVNAVTVLHNSSDETWTWDGNQWERVATIGPGASFGAAMAFDSDRGITVLFGGSTGRQTWEWDGSAWTLVDNPGYEDPGPPSRNAASMCYDSVNHRTVLACGNGPNYERYYDTWLWDGHEWTITGGLPYTAGRLGAAMAFDSTRARCVLFGGATGHFQDRPFGDTWEFDGARWTNVATTGPSPRSFPAMTYDIARRSIVLFSGVFATNDTWLRTPKTISGGPSITTQPSDTTVRFGSSASFSVVASGEGTLTYQWRRNMVPLTDGSHITGANTAVLQIMDTTTDDAGTYDVVVTNPCASVTSEPATLTVSACPGDFNADGTLNSQDFFDFLTAFFNLSPAADFDGSGTVDSADFFSYLTAFFAGCNR